MSRSTFLKVAAAVVVCLVFLSVLVWISFEKNRVRPVPILMYHQIGDKVTNSVWWVMSGEFEAQMRFLYDSGFKTILPRDLVANRKWGKPLPRRPVILTFDDGYLSAMTIAERVLQKYGFQGIIYLPTAYIAKDGEERKNFGGAPCLTWFEVRAMQKRGTFVFGGHTRSHTPLRRSRDPFSEIEGCYDDIVEYGGFLPDSFCYPYGQHGECKEATIDAVRGAGFTTVVVCQNVVAYTGREMRLYELPRVSVMGGRRRFVVDRLIEKEKDDEIILSLRNEGVPITVFPRIRWEDCAEKDRWFPVIELKGPNVELKWTIAEAGKKEEPFWFEVWCQNRVICLRSLRNDSLI